MSNTKHQEFKSLHNSNNPESRPQLQLKFMNYFMYLTWLNLSGWQKKKPKQKTNKLKCLATE